MSVNKVQLANGETIIDISDSTVTPETLAEGVTAHDANGQKITGKMVPGGGSSVQSDWNQTDETAPDFIKNKPFGEVAGDTLTWDIPIDKITEDDLVGGMYIKISDAAVTIADIVNGFTVAAFGEALYVSFNDCIVMTDGIIAAIDAIFVFVAENGAGVETEGIVFSESGIYLNIGSNIYSGKMTIDGFNKFIAIETIDDKYVPDTFAKKQIFYIGLDANGVNRIYKGIDQTEVVSGAEFMNLQSEPKQIVLADNHNAWYIAISITQNGAVYSVCENGTVDLKMAYHGNYTP